MVRRKDPPPDACEAAFRPLGRRTAEALALWGLVAALLVSIPAGLSAGHGERGPIGAGQVVATSVHAFSAPGLQTTSGETPLLEVFTATWCPPCAPADRAIDRLLNEAEQQRVARNSSEYPLAVLAYHPVPDPGAEDPFGIPAGMTRMDRKYDAFWFPSVYVDGVLEDAATTRSASVDAGMEETAFNSYTNLISQARAFPSLFQVTSRVDLQNNTLSLSVQLQATQSVDGPLYVQAALWEDNIPFPGSNGVDQHRMTVRALLDRQYEPDGVQAGDIWSAAWQTSLPGGVQPARAGVTIFVETAWDVEPRDQSGTMMGFALGTGAAVVALLFSFTARKPSRSPRSPPQEDHR